MSDQKKIFISYSWDSPEHKKWVKKFSDDLQALLGEYFKVLLDQNQRRGTSLSRFMKKGLKDAVKVLIIGTPKYKEKSEVSGGVAYETMVISNEMISDMDTTKFYPILRSGSFDTSFPTDIKDRMGDDFSDDKYYEENLKIVVNEIIEDYPIPDIFKQRTIASSDKGIEDQKQKIQKGIEHPGKVTEQLIASLDGVKLTPYKTRLLSVPTDKSGSFIIPNSVIEIEEYAFYRCSNLISVEMPGSVTEIGRNAFSACSSLTSVKISDRVTEIRKSTFYRCTSLTSIEIPESVTKIEDHAFYGCTSLTSIEIPERVTYFGHNAFGSCANLVEIHLRQMKPIDLRYTLDELGLPKITLYVPKGLGEAYRNDDFYKGFKAIIEE